MQPTEIDLLKRIADGIERNNKLLLMLLDPQQRQEFQRQEVAELAKSREASRPR